MTVERAAPSAPLVPDPSLRPTARQRRRAEALGLGRLSMFVPAIMSVGLVFWVLSEIRDLLRSQRRESSAKRAALAATELVESITDSLPPRAPSQRGLRARPVYLLLAAAVAGGGVYVAIGSTANTLRTNGYVRDIAWLLSLALVVSLFAVVYGVVALITFLRFPRPPLVIRSVLAHCLLTTVPVDPDGRAGRPSWRVSAAVLIGTAMSALLSLVAAWSPHVLDRADRTVAGWAARIEGAVTFGPLQLIGRTEIALVLTALAVIAALRCRVLVTAFAGASAAALVLGLTLRPLVARPRPPWTHLAGRLDSYPSGHVQLAAIAAGALPLAVAVLLGRRDVVRPLRIILGGVAVLGAVQRVASGEHWPSDVVGAVLIGTTIVFAVQWSVDRQVAHVACRGCPWSARPSPTRVLGVVHVPHGAHAVLRGVAHLTAAGAAIGIAVLTFTVGLPTNDSGYGFGSGVQRPVQLALAGLVSVGALLAWRWEALGAVLIAFAATGLGLFAAVEYTPTTALCLTAALLVPAVLLWSSWQHRQTLTRIVALALATSVLLGGTWAGAAAVYDSYFGPTHPDSDTPGLPVDRVDWVWSGALGSGTVTVTAELTGGARAARLVVEPAGDGPGAAPGGRRVSPTIEAGEGHIVRLRADGLQPGTRYTYRVEVDGEPDRSRGRGRFTTPLDGPMSFRVALGSCARSGSNGRVYDRIREYDPLLFLALGDLHYGNIAETVPAPFLRAFGTLLTRPAQAALYREVPVAYVWDDHDYGPNDADSTSPGRAAARSAYATAVPHYPFGTAGGAIAQAFTVGRVRFVLTDNRSERTADTMLGAEQQAWLLDEVRRSSRTHALVVWANSVPWIGAAAPGADGWAGYDAERREIADALASAGVDNLVMVSGDAHMVAADDGTNSAYATVTRPDGTAAGGFPVLHAAALDRPGNVKGGPYSEGAHPGGGQYGELDVTDDGGDTVTVRFRGRNWAGETLVQWEGTFPVGRDA